MKQIHHSFGTLFAAASLAAAGWVASGTALAADVVWSNGGASQRPQVLASHVRPEVIRRSEAVVQQRGIGTRRPAAVLRPTPAAQSPFMYAGVPDQAYTRFLADGGRDHQPWRKHVRRHHGAYPVVPGQDGNWGNN